VFRFWYFGFSAQQYFQGLRLTGFQHCPDSIRFFQIAHQSTLLYDLHIAASPMESPGFRKKTSDRDSSAACHPDIPET